MRYFLLALVLLLALGGCQQKKTISPTRYTPQEKSEQAVVEPPAAAPAPSAASSVKENDVVPAPKLAPESRPAPKPAAPPPPKPMPPAPPAKSAEEVTYQIGAFSKRENALALAGRAESAGFSVVVEDDVSMAMPQHRVLATYAGSDGEARGKLLDMGVYDPILVGGRVDPTLKKQAAASQPATQSSSRPEGGVSYQVGAFGEIENATQIKNQLEQDGFHVELEETSDPATRYRVIATWPGTDEEGRARLLEHDIFNPIIVSAGPQGHAAPPPSATPAAEPVPAPAPPVAPKAEPQGEDLFRFQVGAFSSIENAEALRTRLDKAGFKTEMELVEEQGAPKYRILAIKRGAVPVLRQELMSLGVNNPILLGY